MNISANLYTLPLVVIMFAILAILGWVLITSKGNWLVKALMISLCFGFGFCVWHAMEKLESEMEGWPTEEVVRSQFELHWAVVNEPNKSLGKKGDIFIWVTPLDENYMPKKPKESKGFMMMMFKSKERHLNPRSYKIDYSREVHQQLQQAMQGIKDGKRMMGKPGGMKGKKGKGREGIGQDGKLNDGGGESQEQDYIFHELPNPQMPPK